MASLAGLAVPAGWRTDLLVVENGAKGRAEAIVGAFRHPEIEARYRFVPAPGKSAALNLAVAENKGQVLLFTDDDVRLPANWVEEMAGPCCAGRETLPWGVAASRQTGSATG